MVEIEGYMKNYFKNEFEVFLVIVPENYDQSTCFVKKNINIKT